MTTEFNYEVRPAVDEDMPLIAEAHHASINELGHGFYNEDAMRFWERKRSPDGYRKARDQDGEVFFVATPIKQTNYVYGFSSYKLEEGKHRLQALYVRGIAAHKGVGRALLLTIEKHARAAGATELHVEASLTAENFYIAHGFREVGRNHKPVPDTNSLMTAIIMIKKY